MNEIKILSEAESRESNINILASCVFINISERDLSISC